MALVDNAFYVNGNTTVLPANLGTSNNSTGATLTLAVASVPAASMVVVLVNEATATTAGSLSDGTNSYTLATSEVVSGSVGIGQIFYFYYSAAQSGLTLTYTKATSGDKAAMSAMFATGIASSSALDSAVTAVAQSTSATPSLTSGTPAVAGEWIVAATCWDAASALAYTNPNPFTGPFTTVTTQNAASLGGGNINVNGSSAVVYAPTLSAAPTGAALMIVGFKPAGTQSGWWGVTEWAASTTKVCGNLIRQNQTPTAGNERVFVCIASTSGTGTTNTTEPAWVLTRGAKTTDNTVTWQEATGIAGLNGDLTNTPAWSTIKGTAISLGQVIQNGAGTLLLICTTGGTAGSGAEPSWAAFTNAGATTTDNTAHWTTLGAPSNYSIWNSPHARLQNAYGSNWVQAGNNVFVSSAHAESQGNANLTFNPIIANTLVTCVKNSPGTVPPGSADVTTGASLTTYGNFGLVVESTNGSTIGINGLTFSSGTGTDSAGPVFTGPGYLRNCAVIKGGSAVNTGAIQFGAGNILNLINTTVQFGNTGDHIYCGNQTLWQNTPSAIQGSIIPTTLFNLQNATEFTAEGVDFSAVTGTLFLNQGNNTATPQLWLFKNCAFAPGLSFGGFFVGTLDIVVSDSAATNYFSKRTGVGGNYLTSPSIWRSSGASDGATPLSWQISTGGGASFGSTQFSPPPIAQWNSLTGKALTVTVYGIINATTVPNNDWIWIEVEYIGSNSLPLGTIANSTKANELAIGTALPADSVSDWNTTTARQNLTAYVIGNTITVPDNPNRLFFCTANGTSAASEPAGYASAVDGGSVTDGGATFRAGCRFSMSVTFTPQMAGYVYVVVKAAQPSSTFWIDPLLAF